ncbi:hypothetical protein DEU56DRAFT_751774 [Suillus clintonianus]|uniref:uncharacterized protein n=1 Tax=Suillus clintonianus TaxID=1904413 RepID=UPI001B85DA76|nr:uncharacterized protein DEU56DRAFT_751774 [Suillus clintonianus]KAG2153158.1 hypothetical protein DEU56DRAFT_751774 [Suillus clintonianus]
MLPPVGSPYPYTFLHIRRNNTYSGHLIHTAPSSNYNPSHPSEIKEQLVRPSFDSTAMMSIQSSPSYQPVSLPFLTGRVKRHQTSLDDLRIQSTKLNIKLPPRVDSTHPRYTSPEPYSSGKEHFEVVEEGNWVNGMWRGDRMYLADLLRRMYLADLLRRKDVPRGPLEKDVPHRPLEKDVPRGPLESLLQDHKRAGCTHV